MPEHGKISTEETQYQVQVNYSCDVGYELNSTENSKVCQSNAQWLPDESVSCQSNFYILSVLFFLWQIGSAKEHLVGLGLKIIFH